MQGAELYDDEEQKEQSGAVGATQVLPPLPNPYPTSGDQIGWAGVIRVPLYCPIAKSSRKFWQAERGTASILVGKESDKQVTDKTATNRRVATGRVKVAMTSIGDDTGDLEAMTMAEEANLFDSLAQDSQPASKAPAQPARHKMKARSSSLAAWQRVAVIRYFYEVYLELRKVTWPTREEAWNMTLVVIAISVVIGLILGAVDFGLSQFVQHIISPY